MAAVSGGYLETVEAMLKWADTQQQGSSSSTVALCAAKDSAGKTAYQLAADKKATDLMKLLKVGAVTVALDCMHITLIATSFTTEHIENNSIVS